MKTRKINPDSEILQQLDGHWQQLMLVLLLKHHPNGVEITSADIEKAAQAFPGEGGPVIFTHGHKESIELKVISGNEAKHIAELDRLKTNGKGH